MKHLVPIDTEFSDPHPKTGAATAMGFAAQASRSLGAPQALANAHALRVASLSAFRTQGAPQ